MSFDQSSIPARSLNISLNCANIQNLKLYLTVSRSIFLLWQSLHYYEDTLQSLIESLVQVSSFNCTKFELALLPKTSEQDSLMSLIRTNH